MKPLIAICSQDADLYLLLSHILEVDGFAAVLAATVEDALELAERQAVRAVVLDCRPDNQMAAGSGLLKQDGRASALPCVALISPGAESQHIALLRSGIDESFVRPFAPAKLLEYLRSRLSIGQTSGLEFRTSKSLRYSDVEMQIDTHRVHVNGSEIVLGPIEYKLLRHMLENPERVLSRDELIGVAWSDGGNVDQRTVDAHISQLRKLLRQRSKSVGIRTVRLAGYALEDRIS